MQLLQYFCIEFILVSNLFFLLGHIFLGRFEEKTPVWRKLTNYFIFVILICTISFFCGSMAGLGLLLLPVLYIHLIFLPTKGINGWMGEPKDKYYEYRGWK